MHGHPLSHFCRSIMKHLRSCTCCLWSLLFCSLVTRSQVNSQPHCQLNLLTCAWKLINSKLAFSIPCIFLIHTLNLSHGWHFRGIFCEIIFIKQRKLLKCPLCFILWWHWKASFGIFYQIFSRNTFFLLIFVGAVCAALALIEVLSKTGKITPSSS